MTQMDLTDIYRTLHPNIKEYAFFSARHGTCSKIGQISKLNRPITGKVTGKVIETVTKSLPPRQKKVQDQMVSAQSSTRLSKRN